MDKNHQQTLANIARLEMELGIGDESPKLLLDDLARRWAHGMVRGIDRRTMCSFTHEDVVRRAWDLGLVSLAHCIKSGYVPQYPPAHTPQGSKDTDNPFAPYFAKD